MGKIYRRGDGVCWSCASAGGDQREQRRACGPISIGINAGGDHVSEGIDLQGRHGAICGKPRSRHGTRGTVNAVGLAPTE